MKLMLIKSFSLTVLILILLLLVSCSKKSDSATTSSEFSWTWNGTSYSGNFKEAFLQSMSTTPIIISGTGTSVFSAGSGPRISVTSFNIGNYILSNGIPNYISFIAPNGDNLQSTTGNLNITANSNNQMNGNFSATLINSTGQTSSISGSFTNLKISQ